MQLSETIKLYSTKEQETLIQAIMFEYISTVNSLVSDATSGTNINKYTSRNVEANLPSALKNQCIRDAKSIVKKHYKTCHKAVLKNRNLAKKGSTLKITAPSLPILKKPCCYVNNQNFKIKNGCVEFPVMVNGKSKRIAVKTKHFSELSDAVIRFAPIDINNQQYASVHNMNENIGTDAVVRAVEFCKYVLKEIRV